MITGVSAWNALDWLLAGAVLFSTAAGLLRGLIRTVFGLAGLIGGLAVAAWQYRPAAQWVRSNGWVAEPQIAAAVTYVAIAAAVMILFGILGSIVRRTAHAVGLGLLDRLLGGAVGALRGMLVAAALVIAIHSVAPNTGFMRSSQLSSYFLAAAHGLSFVVPRSFR